MTLVNQNLMELLRAQQAGVSVPAPATTPVHVNREPPRQIKVETDDEIIARITERFEIVDDLVMSAIDGGARAVFVSGPAGCGKSFGIEQKLLEHDEEGTCWEIFKGFSRATGLYKALFRNRDAGNILVFDDADDIFRDETSLNLLKAACDTGLRRRVAWGAETKMIDAETGEAILTSFDFEGSIIFLTNLDFDAEIDRGSRLAPHLKALISRSHYVDLEMSSNREVMLRIEQVVKGGMLENHGLDAEAEEKIMEFVKKNVDNLRELSLRTVIKIANLYKVNPDWERRARITCFRRGVVAAK